MPFSVVRFLDVGYCTQLGYLAGRATRGPTRFDAVCVYLEHPQHGASLIDSGYGPHFQDATRRFPSRLHRWATPMDLPPGGDAWSILQDRGLPPENIENIFISHFHADHIAGLRHFPGARFVYRHDSYEVLLLKNSLGKVHNGFLPGLVPADFAQRGRGVAEEGFAPGTGDLAEFRVLDYWDDGDLLMVDLPGHALGHTGYVIRTKTERIFYIVDACWCIDSMLGRRRLPWLSRRVQHDYGRYVATQEKLRRLADRGWRLVACHCPRTQAYVS